MRNKKYINDYKIEYTDKGKAEPVYAGDVYRLNLEEHERRGMRAALCGVLLLAACALGVAGYLTTPAMNAFYVVVPYGISFLPFGFMSYYEFVIIYGKTELTRKEFVNFTKTSPKLSSATFTLSLASLVGALIYSFVNGGVKGQLAHAALCACLCGLCIFNNFLLRGAARRFDIFCR